MQKPTLFDLDVAELGLLAQIEAIFAEPMDDAIVDPGAEAQRLADEHLAALAEVQEQLAAKLAGYVKAIKAKTARADLLRAEAAAYAAEAERLANKARSEADTAEFLQERLKLFLERRGLQRFEAGTYTLKVVNQGGKLPLLLTPGVTPAQVPPQFRKEIPATWDWNKAEIERALKDGQRLEVTMTVSPSASGDSVPVTLEWARHGDRPTKLKIS